MDLLTLKTEASRELTGHILPFWSAIMVDKENGGFYGRMDGKNRLIKDAPKGGILNARILWTFSSAYNTLGDTKYLKMATYTREYLFAHFTDTQYGGTYWSLDASGNPLDTKKQIYSQAFCIYALIEYYLASGDRQSLEYAITLFNLIEQHSFDKVRNGYLEAFTREWSLLEDMRLSDKDANEKKTMNTHLHILEAYTNLYRVWKDQRLEKQLKNLVRIFLDLIIDPVTSHLNLFFDEEWNCKSSLTSYGHDIECSWLLTEAAEVLKDAGLLAEVKSRCLAIVEAVNEGYQPDGSIIYEKNNSTGHEDRDRHWWPQSEAVVGYLNAYRITGKPAFLEQAQACFQYICKNLIDPLNGEWYWGIRADGAVNLDDDKAGFWKCPYHNSRMCIEIIKR